MESSITAVLVLVCVSGLCLAKHPAKGFIDKNADACITVFKGCKLLAGDCVCGVTTACSDPYPYINKHQCEKDVTGKLDKCRKDPCLHGQCVQVKKDDGHRKWGCSCSGSGYFGRRCENQCPPLKKGDPIPKNYPTDCIY